MSRSYRAMPVMKQHRHHNAESLHGSVRTMNRNRFAKTLREGDLAAFAPAGIWDAGLDFDDPILRSPRRRALWCSSIAEMAALCRK